MANLIVEIGCEELPAGYISPALEQWQKLLGDALAESRLAGTGMRTAGTPRRLAIFVEGVLDRQEDVVVEVSGPPAKVAFDAEGKPTKAAIGFAKTQGVEPDALHVKETERGKYCVAEKQVAGRPAADVLAEILPKTIAAIRFPKSMRWVTKSGVTFARPVRWILAMLGEHLVGFEFNGVKSGAETIGHAFLSPERVTLQSADFDDYIDALRQHHVITDMAERRGVIQKKIQQCLDTHGSKLDDFELLDEVTNLVEFPNIVEGSFEEKYLKLPEAVLVESMRSHQRYFPVRDSAGRLLPRFITVINRDDTHAAVIREGNERVLRARLADAEFFMHEDARHPLAQRLDDLKGVTFQVKLGSVYERVMRLKQLARKLAEHAKLDAQHAAYCERAAELCKCDLVTSMVYEFPSLQGIVGREYALRDDEPAEVAEAIAEHYAPRGADDAIPQTLTGSVLSLAEKLDAILGCFSVGLAPTGSQDPYALRRAAQGVIRILMEDKIAVKLDFAVQAASSLQPSGLKEAEGVEERVLSFLRDRLYNYLTDKGYRYDHVNAVIATGFAEVSDVRDRLDALRQLSQQPDWEALVTVVQRTFNIIRNIDVIADVRPELLEAPEEKAVWEMLAKHEAAIQKLASQRQYVDASRLFAEAFVDSVHAFFDRVFVNVEDENVRQNRLALMKRINRLYCALIADLSEIVMTQ